MPERSTLSSKDEHRWHDYPLSLNFKSRREDQTNYFSYLNWPRGLRQCDLGFEFHSRYECLLQFCLLSCVGNGLAAILQTFYKIQISELILNGNTRHNLVRQDRTRTI
jgi:hypothetical protein